MINASQRAAVAVKTNRNRYTIPVFPHVKKFILKTYNLTPPIKTEEYHTFGKLVTKALLDNRSSAEYNDLYRNKLTDTLVIMLTKEQSEFSPRINRLLRLNIDMDRVFKDHLIAHILTLRPLGIPAHTACKMFLEKFGIDENEYSLDAAYKCWQREGVKK
jgi:hypothetical protein